MSSEVLSKSVLIEKFRVSDAGEIKVSSDVRRTYILISKGNKLADMKNF